MRAHWAAFSLGRGSHECWMDPFGGISFSCKQRTNASFELLFFFPP